MKMKTSKTLTSLKNPRMFKSMLKTTTAEWSDRLPSNRLLKTNGQMTMTILTQDYDLQNQIKSIKFAF